MSRTGKPEKTSRRPQPRGRAEKSAVLIDPEAFEAQLFALAEDADAASPEVRAGVLSLAKAALEKGREIARAELEETGGGRHCSRQLSHLQDVILCALFRFASQKVFRVSNPSSSEQLCLAAVGGYGRGMLAPGSDIDLLFLFPYKTTAWSESVTEYILLLLWDMNLKVGHATRTVAECIKLSRQDMTIRTALLEARYLCGEKDLFDEFEKRFDKDVVAGTAREFITAKLAERDTRHRRAGNTRYLVEPQLKEGKGGLRDLQTLYWIAKYYYRVPSAEALVGKGVLSRAEYRLFRKCGDFLWAVRCHLHFLTGRAEERLSFDIQPELARRLGYQKHHGLQGVERFMKHYFLIAKDVGDLTRIICAGLEEREAKNAPGLNRLFRGLRGRRRDLPGSDEFFIDNNRINSHSDDVFERDPVNLIRIFHLAGKANLAFHPDALRLITRSLKRIDKTVRNDPEANRLFLDILTSQKHAEIVLRRMNETGVLGRFIPEFGKVVAMMQFNMYHHYTVDEHLIRSIGTFCEMDGGGLSDEHPLSHEILPGIRDKTVLYVALFLHDIAKGRKEDHSVAGAKIARRLCPRFGLSPAQTETVAWLVEQHLTMSIVAQSRDLSDRRTIVDFANIVESMDRLNLLLLLTVCDIRAVGPGVWNGWKGQLLRTLYYECELILTGGFSKATRQQRVAGSREALAARLADWGEAERNRVLNLHYPAYWLRVDEDEQVRHAELLRAADREKKGFAFEINPMAFESVTAITILTPDHPNLLSVMAGACSAMGANIVDAQFYTTTDGRALDTIRVSRLLDTNEEENMRGQRIARLIEQALRGEVKLPEMVASRKKRKSRRDAFSIEPEVSVDNSLSDRFTVIEVSCLDRVGLLYDIGRSISDLNLNIASAHIATFGERAVDTFYVTDLLGYKIDSRNRQNLIRKRILAAVNDDGGRPDRSPEREKDKETDRKPKARSTPTSAGKVAAK
ncbi:MAG TPA: [protein-PII] uridylyltransferase [Afifellaceae bacterium]|nr:[protein-PII] uridylyltransferase [Afifellaceae bacterium]